MSARASGFIKALTVCPNGELITAREKLVAMVLADSHQDKAKHFTYPSVDTIAAESMCDRRSCQRYLESLERKGVIRRLRPVNQGRSYTVFYFFPALDVIPEGWQDAALFSAPFFAQRAAEGRQKGGGRAAIEPAAHIERAQEREQKPEQEQNPPLSPVAFATGETWAKTEDGDAGKAKKSTPGVAENSGNGPRLVASVLGNLPVSDEVRRAANAFPAEGQAPVDHATDRVMRGIGATANRLRRKLRAVIAQRAEMGELPEEVADRMIAAWQKQAKNSRLLFKVLRAAPFFEEGHWLDANTWNWDQRAVREEQLRADAAVGSGW